MDCSDPFIEGLKSEGYSAIRLPRVDVHPLQLLASEAGALERVGELGQLLAAGDVPTPPVIMDARVANVRLERTGRLRAGIGLSVLEGVIAAMGGSPVGVRSAYRHAGHITFEFTDVLEDRVEVTLLDRFLARADVEASGIHFARLLEADDLYVITATLKSRRFRVLAGTSDGADAAVEVPALQGVLGAKVEVSGGVSSASKLTYQGPEALVFGFKAVRLLYQDGAYRALRPVAAGRTMRSGGRVSSADQLALPGPFARLRGL